ncbi:MAG: carboxypeptidase regulatory-like domain-containing protein [Acidobacteriota bacterium]
MNRALPFAAGLLAAAVATTVASVHGAPAEAVGGNIEGRVRVSGPTPGNPFIRLGADPLCARLNAGQRPVQEFFVKTPDGGLANVFVAVQGTFPATPVPTTPAVLDQQACIYRPHVIGARVGQTLQVRNSDPLLHNVHSDSQKGNAFDVGQPQAGMLFRFPLKGQEVLLHIKCDVHGWMNGYVGVVNHPYFAVSGAGGAFRITNVPAGRYTLQAWHERLGPLAASVTVKAGASVVADFTYTGSEKGGTPAGFALQDVVVPTPTMAARIPATVAAP